MTMLFALPAGDASAQLRVARIFADHAVLQRDQPVAVWGWSRPNSKVKVALAGATRKTRADVNGRWEVSFPPMEAGGPYRMEVSGKKQKITFDDLWMGDVWLCSGQSNMEWPLEWSEGGEEEASRANYPLIRQFYAPHEVALAPLDDLRAGFWQVCAPETAPQFTAVGYYFAQKIQAETGVPIGLLHISWGGSQAEAWLSPQGLRAVEDLLPEGASLPDTWEGADRHLERLLKKKCTGNPDFVPDAAIESAYTGVTVVTDRWIAHEPLGQWDWKGIWAWRGTGIMRRKVSLPADAAQWPSTLRLGTFDGPLELFINGENIHRDGAGEKLVWSLPPHTWQPGDNHIALKMRPARSPEWFGLGLSGSPEALNITLNGQQIPLADSDWYFMPVFSEPHHFVHSSNNLAGIIYNAMIHPVTGYPIRGVLWYQGESNAERAAQYRRTFSGLIRDWRQRWGQDFPFYFVQLASFQPRPRRDGGSEWAELRASQDAALQLSQTGMAVTIDIGNKDDIHPKNKKDVGLRLAAQALQKNYLRPVVADGPTLSNVQWDGATAVLQFKHTDGGLKAHNSTDGQLRAFTVADEVSHAFLPAEAFIDGETVVVKHPEGKVIAAVRYAWKDAPTDANLFNGAGFPAVPFRTDSWPQCTEKVGFE